MQNTLRSRDSPVINTLGSLDSLVYYSPESFFVNLVLCLFKVHLEVDSPVYSSQGRWDSPVYSSPGSRFWTWNHFTDFKEHITIFKGGIIPKIVCTVHYFTSLGTCDLCLQNLLNLKDSNRLHGVFIAGELITNTKNSTNIRKNSKSFLGMPIGTRRSCSMKKTGQEKFRDTVPLLLTKNK